MSKTILAAQGLDGYVRVQLPKGVVLKLRQADYYAGIEAGKIEARAQQQAQREATGQAETEAQALAWIDTDTGGPL